MRMLKVGGLGRLTAHARGGKAMGMGMERGRGRRAAVSGSAHRACAHGSKGGDGMFCYGLGMGHRGRWWEQEWGIVTAHAYGGGRSFATYYIYIL